MTTSSLKLRDILLQFLKGSPNVFYPVIETRILQLNPLQITDDLVNYLDISSIQEGVLKKIGSDSPGANYKLILNDWKFVFKKVPNTHEFYFDIISDDYRVVREPHVIELAEYPSKMVDDQEIHWNFEYRKRKELEEIIKLNMRVKKSPVKPKTRGETTSPGRDASRSSGQTPSKSVESGRGSSYIRSGNNLMICPDILPIEELLDLPIPIYTKETIQRAYFGSEVPVGRESYFYRGESQGRYSKGRYSRDRDDEEGLGKRGPRASIDDVMKALTRKLLDWNQLVFNQKTFEHLRQRPYMLHDG